MLVLDAQALPTSFEKEVAGFALRGQNQRVDLGATIPAVLSYKSKLKQPARKLRSNQTEAEQKLWLHLRGKQLNATFNRQKPLGPYIVDFYCHAARLVIELDGGQHFEAAHQARDVERDAQLRRMGLTVLRFDNLQVLNETEAVVSVIHQTVQRESSRAKSPR